MTNQLINIPTELIDPNPDQPRQHFDQAALDELAQSIAQHGIIQPLIVERTGDRYTLHAGERRLRAAKLACLNTLPCVVAASKFDADQRLERALVENLQRQDMTPTEEAQAYGKLRDRLGLSHRALARRCGVGEHKVKQRLQLLELEPEIQSLIDKKRLPFSVEPVAALLSVPAGETRLKLAQQLAKSGAGLTAVVNACARVNAHLTAQSTPTESRQPAIALSGLATAPQTKRTPRWDVVRAAAAGACAECNSNPGLPALPEPSWTLFLGAAGQECGSCEMESLARAGNLDICKECPAVGLLRRVAAGVLEVRAS